MHEHILFGLTTILVLGVGAQWLAQRLHLPSILLLLVAGFLAGPVFGFIDPDDLLGPVLLPFVSMSVAVVLFEGGLSLSFRQIRGVGHVVWNLVTVGMLVTWGLSAVGARYVIGLSWEVAALAGAILVVSGPTVIAPLLHHVRPSGAAGPTLRWESILIDPVGAVLAVLVFNLVVKGGVAAGDTKRYQLWYRNPFTTPCGAGFNLSNGIEMVFTP